MSDKRIKDYLSAEEMNDFMFLGYIMDYSVKFLENWKSRGNLQKDEEKYAKYMNTYAQKFYRSVLDRLNEKAMLNVIKRLEKYNVLIVDTYTKKKMENDEKNAMNVIRLERDQFETWCEEIMNATCKNCTKHWSECQLSNIFEYNSVPESGENLPNCRYAYKK